jgi:GxxExxY protein
MLRVSSSLSEAEEAIVKQAVDVGFTVHRVLGPGFKERIYEEAYCLEMDARGMRFERQKKIEVPYKSWLIPGQTIDLIIEGLVLVELKAVPKLRRIHRAQVLSYLKATRLPVGLVMNFSSELFKNGIKRVVFVPPLMESTGPR